MQTTFELQHPTVAMDKKLILESLYTLENIWNVLIGVEIAGVSFEYANLARSGKSAKETAWIRVYIH
jgi:hypothetical protein